MARGAGLGKMVVVIGRPGHGEDLASDLFVLGVGAFALGGQVVFEAVVRFQLDRHWLPRALAARA
jgi:hypothetical protein